MSFGWSAGDVIAGLRAVYDIWEAISDGPLNAKYEAVQFFDHFYHVTSRLEEWESRKPARSKDGRLVQSHRELRNECTLFIKEHFTLIQQINPRTKATRPGRSTWLQKVSFTQDQVLSLYQRVSWPTQRETVAHLREKLLFFLTLAAWDVALDTNDIVRDIRTTNRELIATNYKLVTSHLDLVASITSNLKRVTYPLEQGRQVQEIDYPMLRQFERALRPPQPIGDFVQDSRRQFRLTLSSDRQHDEAQYSTVAAIKPESQDMSAFGKDEVRGLISQRLDNLSNRVKRAETMETISEHGPQDTTQPSTQQLLDRLRDIRAQIGTAVGISTQIPTTTISLVVTEPGNALRQELEAWDMMKERIEREILHPPRARLDTGIAEAHQSNFSGGSSISTPSPRVPGSLLLPVSYESWMSQGGGSNPSQRSSSLSPKNPRRLSDHSVSNSISSASRVHLNRSGHEFHVQISYPRQQNAIPAIIRSISRDDDGEVRSISSYCMNGSIKYRHSVDYNNVDPKIETSMIPFVDNGHTVDGLADREFRVQFKGSHILEIFRVESKVEVPIDSYHEPPIYKFLNEPEFLEFQRLLLNKEIRYCTDISVIKTLASDPVCRVDTIRLIFEPFSRSKYIIYFQHLGLAPDQKAGFIEWPVSIFKELGEPSKRCKTLTLESQDGKALSSPRRLQRRGTQGSVATVASNETPDATFRRMQEKLSSSKGKIIKGLVIEFYDPQDCHRFWVEFMKQEPSPFTTV